MRDFGFWVRIVAISQLFSLVLANYGDGWLAQDNPILTMHEKPAPPKPLSEIMEEARPKGAAAANVSGSMKQDKLRDIAGWGGADEPEADWNEDDSADVGYIEPWFEDEDKNESDWGKVIEP